MSLRQILIAAVLSAGIASLLVLAPESADEPAAPAKSDRISAPAVPPAPVATKAVTERWTTPEPARDEPKPEEQRTEAAAPRDAASELPSWANIRQVPIAKTAAPAPAAPDPIAAQPSAESKPAPAPERPNAAAAKKRESFARKKPVEPRSKASSKLGSYYEISRARGFGEERVKRACVPGLRMPQVCYYPQNIRRNFPVRLAD